MAEIYSQLTIVKTTTAVDLNISTNLKQPNKSAVLIERILVSISRNAPAAGDMSFPSAEVDHRLKSLDSLQTSDRAVAWRTADIHPGTVELDVDVVDGPHRVATEVDAREIRRDSLTTVLGALPGVGNDAETVKDTLGGRDGRVGFFVVAGDVAPFGDVSMDCSQQLRVQ